MEIIKKLQLNKHPRNAVNFSLVGAASMKVSHDGVKLTIEEDVIRHAVINTAIQARCGINFKIVGWISTPYEVVIFAVNNSGKNSGIFRYNENTNTCTLVNTKWTWSGGYIRGDYTYNVQNHLIIVVGEFDRHVLVPNATFKYNGNVPLKVIDLDETSDVFITGPRAYACVPDVPYAVIPKFNYANGYSYKGYYEFYIRYKISDNNYTQWYYINGKPIVDVARLKEVMIYVQGDLLNNVAYTETENSGTSGHVDFVTSNEDYCNIALEFNLQFTNTNANNFKQYQIGYVVTSKTYNKAFRSNDIDMTNTSYLVNPKTETEIADEELIVTTYNYYNVKTVEVYKNRVYIANYKERDYNVSKEELLVNGSQFDFSKIRLTIEEDDQSAPIDVVTKYRVHAQTGGEFYTYDWNEGIYRWNNDYTYNSSDVDTIEYNGETWNIINVEKMFGPNTADCIFDDDVSATHHPTYSIYIMFRDRNDRTGYYLEYHFAAILLGQLQYVGDSFIVENYASEYNHFFIGSMTVDSYDTSAISAGDSNLSEGVDDILHNYLMPGEIYSFYVHFVDSEGHVTNGIKIDPVGGSNYEIYTNHIGDKLYKITGVPDGDVGYVLNVNALPLNQLPNEYIAYFISYKKFEKSNKLVGLAYDTERFTNGYINYADKVDAGVSHLNDNYDTIPNGVSYVLSAYRALSERSTLTYYNCSKFLVNKYKGENLGAAITIDVRVANADRTKNIGKESYLYIKNGYSTLHLEPKVISLYNDNNYIYCSDSKVLVPTAAVVDADGFHDNKTGYNGFIAFDSVIIYQYGGFVLNTADGKIFDAKGKKEITISNEENPYFCYIFNYFWDYPLHIRRYKNPPKVVYAVPDYGSSGSEGKPKHIAQTIVEPKDSIDLFEYPHPNKSELGSYKLFEEYDANLVNALEFNKTIRRSSVIQDESKRIAWREFLPDAYINLNENKGIITNMVHLGTSFFVHTEHSLFMYDMDASLKTEDKNVQLYQPDMFEAPYREVFTADKGFGGLQDRFAWKIGTYGYIFYNNDFNKIYRLDGGNLIILSDDIEQHLKQLTPTNVKIADDIYNERLLFKYDYNIADGTKESEVISYCYKNNINSFISLHEYHFINAINTKTKTYFINISTNKTNLNAPSLTFNFDREQYHGFVDNGMLNSGGVNNFATDLAENYDGRSYYPIQAYIDIIVNTEYETLKSLEYISYNLVKRISPVEKEDYKASDYVRNHPYAGDYLAVFNEDINTNYINIKVDNLNQFNNYKYPHYELSKWNFNYFRVNNINDDAEIRNLNRLPTWSFPYFSNMGNTDIHRRLYGNYFIIRFCFNCVTPDPEDATKSMNQIIEFESLETGLNYTR